MSTDISTSFAKITITGQQIRLPDASDIASQLNKLSLDETKKVVDVGLSKEDIKRKYQAAKKFNSNILMERQQRKYTASLYHRPVKNAAKETTKSSQVIVVTEQ